MPSVKLGRLPAKVDPRTLRLKNVLKAPEQLPDLPQTFDVDDGLGANLPEELFGNDRWGDCVIVGRANWTLRAEYYEQMKTIPITLKEVLKEYWKEQGACAWCHPDNGLVMLDSLNAWRKGWKAGGRTYNIYAFAALEVRDRTELQYATYLLNGGYIGFYVTDKAMEQFDKGEVWDLVPDANVIGGHAVYVVGYNLTGPVCVTWGKRQQMTWRFYEEQTDEAFAVVDNRDAFLPESPVDINKLKGYLDALANV